MSLFYSIMFVTAFIFFMIILMHGWDWYLNSSCRWLNLYGWWTVLKFKLKKWLRRQIKVLYSQVFQYLDLNSSFPGKSGLYNAVYDLYSDVCKNKVYASPYSREGAAQVLKDYYYVEEVFIKKYDTNPPHWQIIGKGRAVRECTLLQGEVNIVGELENFAITESVESLTYLLKWNCIKEVLNDLVEAPRSVSLKFQETFH